MPSLAIDITSPGYLMAQMLNTIAHDIIQNSTNRCNQIGELTFFLKQLKLQKYGQIHVRTTMATLLAELCGCDNICLEDWNDKDWDEVITEFSQLYQVLIRKDASHFFVPRLLEKGEVEFSTDSVAFQRDQKTFKNRNVDIKLKKQINNHFREIIAILKFQRAFSIIRCHIENLMDEKDEEGLEEESVLPDEMSQKYWDYIHASFDDCANAKKALVSLVCREENEDTFKLYIKKPSELNIHFKNTSFRQFYNLQNLQDRFDYVVRGWEDMVLPLPMNQTIGKYTIPEVRLAETNDEENDSVGDVDFGDENDGTDDENEGQLSGSDEGQISGSDNGQKQHNMAEDNDDEDSDDEGPAESQLHTQPPLKNTESVEYDVEEEEEDDESQIENQLETQPPGKPEIERSISDDDEGMDGEGDGQTETQPHLASKRSENDSSIRNAQEYHDDAIKMRKNAVENLRAKRKVLRMNADPLDNVVELAAKATVARTYSTPPRDGSRYESDAIESVNSRELNEEVSPKMSIPKNLHTQIGLQIEDSDGDEGRCSPPLLKKRQRRNPILLPVDSPDDGLWHSSQTELSSLLSSKTRNKWSEAEVTALMTGYKLHGKNWSKIKSQFSDALQLRSNVQIKVRIVNEDGLLVLYSLLILINCCFLFLIG